MKSTWTPDREATLRRMWGEGQSAAQIAFHLGGVSREAVIGKVNRLGLTDHGKAVTKPRPICAVPGCGDPLSRKNAMGVCLTHKHHPGLCRCPACQGQPVARRADPGERANVRVVEVPYPTSNSGVALKARVSLVREPWMNP